MTGVRRWLVDAEDNGQLRFIRSRALIVLGAKAV